MKLCIILYNYIFILNLVIIILILVNNFHNVLQIHRGI